MSSGALDLATNYQRGASFERRVKAILEREGFAVVRSAGSHSPADLVAMRGGELAIIQCKRDGKLGPSEWNEFVEFCAKAGGVPILASVDGRKVLLERITGIKAGGRRQPKERWEGINGEVSRPAR